MNDFEEKLNAILSDPNAMAQVADLARSLTGGNQPAEDTTAIPSPASGNTLPNFENLSGLGDLLGQVDPSMIAKLLPLLSELNNGGNSDERMQLLYALRPFLKPERRDKVERAAKAARLLHLGKKFLTNLGDAYV